MTDYLGFREIKIHDFRTKLGGTYSKTEIKKWTPKTNVTIEDKELVAISKSPIMHDLLSAKAVFTTAELIFPEYKSVVSVNDLEDYTVSENEKKMRSQLDLTMKRLSDLELKWRRSSSKGKAAQVLSECAYELQAELKKLEGIMTV